MPNEVVDQILQDQVPFRVHSKVDVLKSKLPDDLLGEVKERLDLPITGDLLTKVKKFRYCPVLYRWQTISITRRPVLKLTKFYKSA